jgi:hypothetical protein
MAKMTRELTDQMDSQYYFDTTNISLSEIRSGAFQLQHDILMDADKWWIDMPLEENYKLQKVYFADGENRGHVSDHNLVLIYRSELKNVNQ